MRNSFTTVTGEKLCYAVTDDTRRSVVLNKAEMMTHKIIYSIALRPAF